MKIEKLRKKQSEKKRVSGQHRSRNTAGCGGVPALFVAVCVLLLSVTDAVCPVTVHATTVSDNDYSETAIDEASGDTLTEDGHVVNETEAAQQLEEAVQTDEIDGWPEGPDVTAKSAILMDADTGTILYAKNIHEVLYPASTTKLLTCLLAAEYLDLSEDITFSENAIAAVPADGSNIGMSVGEVITVEECLYGLMVGSGNECANALAEAVSGSIDAFVELMNERAAELGCGETHFVNANGLHDDEHYTSAYDLCLIAQAFFENEICRTVGNCATYQFTATDTQPDEFTLTNKHEMITGDVAYSGIIGGKTGYTSQAHENLVTGCEQNGVTLICVVMREDDPAQFEDTVLLLDYGYSEFIQVSAEDYAVMPGEDVPELLSLGVDLLGTSTPALTIAEGGKVNLPVTASFENLLAVYGDDNTITYYYGTGVEISDTQTQTDSSSAGTESGTKVGSAVLVPASDLEDAPVSTVAKLSEELSGERDNSIWQILYSFYLSEGLGGTVYVNVSAFIITMILMYAALALFFRLRVMMRASRERASNRRRRARRTHIERNGYDDRYNSYDRPDRYYSDSDGSNVSNSFHGGGSYRDQYYGSDVYGYDYLDDYRDDYH